MVLAARRQDKLKQLHDEIAGEGGASSVVELDVMKYDMVEEVVQDIVKQHGRLDGAFNNAGMGNEDATGTVADLPVDVFKSKFELNFYGTYHCLKAEMQAMTKQVSILFVPPKN